MTKRIIDSFPQTELLPVKCVRLGLVSGIHSGGTPDKSREDYWKGDLPWLGSGSVNQRHIVEPTGFITNEAVTNSSTRLFPKGSVAMALAGQGKTKATVATMGIDAYGNQSMACINNYNGNSRFLFWWLNSLYKEIRGLSSQDTRDGLNQAIIGQLPVPIFDVCTQDAIADFLDRETARIDHLIDMKENLRTTLSELLEAEIQKAILGCDATGAISTNSNLNSRVLSVGTTAKGFHMTPLSRIARIVARGSGQSADVSDKGEVGFITPEDLNWVETTPRRKTNMAPDGYPGDLAVCLIASIGKCSVVDSPFRANPQIAVIRASECDNHWLSYALRVAKRDVVANANMSGVMPFINGSEFMRTVLPVPNLKVQKEIVQRLNHVSARISETIIKTNESLRLLREYRSSLIAAAVTGQIDVATWQHGSSGGGSSDRELERAIT